MKLNKFVVPALALTIFGSTALASAQRGYWQPQQGYGPPPPPPGAYQGGGWDAPPGEFSDFARQGFHDGIEGAHKDLENRRRPNVNNRDEFRHPHVPHEARREYRQGFHRGYDVAMRHAFQGNGYGPRPY